MQAEPDTESTRYHNTQTGRLCNNFEDGDYMEAAQLQQDMSSTPEAVRATTSGSSSRFSAKSLHNQVCATFQATITYLSNEGTMDTTLPALVSCFPFFCLCCCRFVLLDAPSTSSSSCGFLPEPRIGDRSSEGRVSRPGGQGSKICVLSSEPKEHENLFARVPDREDW